MTLKYIFLIVLGIFAVFLLAAQHAEGSERSGFAGMNGDLKLYTGAVSAHPLSEKDYNSNHSLLAVEYRSYMGGYMKNSFYDDTFFVAKTFAKQLEGMPIELGIALGASYGYEKCFESYTRGTGNSKPCPFGYASVFYIAHDFQVGVIYNVAVVAGTVRWLL